MANKIYIAAILVCLVGMSAYAAETVYSGMLSYENGGIVGLDDENVNSWLAEGTQLEWWVTDNDNGLFTYKYTLTITSDSDKEISHFAVEVSDNFEADNIIEVLQGTLAEDQPEFLNPESTSNLGLPESMNAIKFENDPSLCWTVEFTSDRVPVWGDFFAIDGKKAGYVPSIWNSGFGDPDPTDPLTAQLFDHLLVPDTITVVPAPSALLLAMVGFGAVGRLRRKL